MRRLIGLSVMAIAAAVIAQPAQASELSVGLVDMASALPASTSVATVTPATTVDLARIGIATETAGDRAAQTDVRLHALTRTLSAEPVSPLDSQTARLRRGFGAAMMDLYLFGSDGFHLSGGSRFYSRGPARAGTIDSRGLVDMRYVTLLYAPRSVLARASRRMTPALTAGYTKLIQGGFSLGVEGGAMLGKFDTLAGALVRPPRLGGAGLSDAEGKLNQIARMSFGYHF